MDLKISFIRLLATVLVRMENLAMGWKKSALVCTFLACLMPRITDLIGEVFRMGQTLSH